MPHRNLHWYLVQTKPAGEFVAEAHLTRQGYAVYLPRLLQSGRGGAGERVAAFFPRYLFVRLCAPTQSLAPVRSTSGVSSIVRFGFEYAVVPEAIISEIRRRADPTTGLHAVAARGFNPGDRVHVVCGTPFVGLDGIFEREAGHERSIILVELLGREVSVRVPSQWLRPREAA